MAEKALGANRTRARQVKTKTLAKPIFFIMLNFIADTFDNQAGIYFAMKLITSCRMLWGAAWAGWPILASICNVSPLAA